MNTRPPLARTWDIFCTVVDNFGDIGVTWRLAQQLRWQYGQTVRLWIDKPAAMMPLLPGISIDKAIQYYHGITICHWTSSLPEPITVADIVIEAFACELPESYQIAMAACTPPPLWLNLEYLTAEDWVAECHGLPSYHPRLGLTKYFYFPGFTQQTGGLIAEQHLLEQVRDWQKHHPDDPSLLTISLFSYENSAIGELLALWRTCHRPIVCRVPEGQLVKDMSRALGRTLRCGDQYEHGSLTLNILPFSTQSEYDKLLWSSQLNFVRGEDSFVRAQWACRPFVWAIYRQENNTHLLKMDAFLSRYCNTLEPNAARALIDFHYAWNHTGALAEAWSAFETYLPVLTHHAYHWPTALLQHGDLVYRLVKWVENQLK